MLEVRENETSLRKWSGGAAQLRTLEGTLVLLGFDFYATLLAIDFIIKVCIASPHSHRSACLVLFYNLVNRLLKSGSIFHFLKI